MSKKKSAVLDLTADAEGKNIVAAQMGHCCRKKSCKLPYLAPRAGDDFPVLHDVRVLARRPAELGGLPVVVHHKLWSNILQYFTPHKELFYVELERNRSYFIWTSLEHHAEYNGLHPLVRHVLLCISG